MSAPGRGFGRCKEHKAISKFRNKSQHTGSVSRCPKGTYMLAFTSYVGCPQHNVTTLTPSLSNLMFTQVEKKPKPHTTSPIKGRKTLFVRSFVL